MTKISHLFYAKIDIFIRMLNSIVEQHFSSFSFYFSSSNTKILIVFFIKRDTFHLFIQRKYSFDVITVNV